MAFVVDFFSAAFEFEWILILVRCNLDLGTLDLVTTFDLVATLQKPILQFSTFSDIMHGHLHTGQLSRHFFFWQATILRLTQITPCG